MKKIIGIIPSRYNSSRFPGKPLIDLCGKSMIQRVYDQSKKSTYLSEVIVATDDERIYDHVLSFGGSACMTSSKHKTGTDRCMEVVSKYELEFFPDYVVNIQGDEPMIDPNQIDELCQILITDDVEIASQMRKITNITDLTSPNSAKIVVNLRQEAIYFSRSPIPFYKDIEMNEWLALTDYFKHIGIYAYRTDVLKAITKLNQSKLEKTESLEQLRWIENGYKIHMVITEYEPVSIDIPSDANHVRELLHNQKITG
jgi:3-deoxy-manno-octulosonate cytidylyltransferase (CMP-KDO synthetase)